MIGLLIMTHETLGQAYAQVAAHFFGSVPQNVRILSVRSADQPETLAQQAGQLVDELHAHDGVLLLTDIFGATPCNTAQKLIRNDKTLMLTGLNAPMMVKAMHYADKVADVRQLAEEVRQAAINGIMIVDYEQVSTNRD